MKRDLILWMTIFAGPAIWFLTFGANFALVPWACAFQWTPALFVICGLALAAIAASGGVAYTQWRHLGRDLPGEGGGAIPRARLMAISGILISAISFLIVLSQSAVQAILKACD